MSTYVGRLFTAVSSALEFNTATLSGAIDIVVIEDDQGRRQCSPFHVRFGKLQLLRSRGIPVDIELNGNKTNLRMLLGAAGEAYFYNPDHHAARPDAPDPAVADLPPHISLTDDIGDFTADLPVPIRSASQQHTSPHPLFAHATQDPCASGGLPRTPTNANRGKADMGMPKASRDSFASLPLAEKPVMSQVLETTETDYPFGYISDSEVELTRKEREGTTEVVDEPRSPPLYAIQRKWTTTVARDPAMSRAGGRAESSGVKAAFAEISESRLEAPEHHGALKNGSNSATESSGGPNSALFGLPEMADGKREAVDEAGHERAETSMQGSSTIPAVRDLSSEQENTRTHSDISKIGQDAPARPKLGNTDDTFVISNSISDVVGEEDSKLDCRSVDGYDADDDDDRMEDLQEQVAYVLSRPKRLPFAKRREPSVGGEGNAEHNVAQEESIDSAEGGEKAASPSTREGVIQMSRCGNLINSDMEEVHIVELFERHQVSFEEFSSNPAILHDPSLLFRIDDRLVELRVAAPFIFSVLAFNERMDIDALAREMVSKPAEEIPKSVPTPSRRFGWFGWSSPKVEGEPLLQEEDLDVLDNVNSESPLGAEGVVVLDGENAQVEDGGIGSEAKPSDPEEARRELATQALATKETSTNEELLGSTGAKKNGETSVDFELRNEIEGVADALELEEIQLQKPVSEVVAISFSDIDPNALSLKPTQDELNGLDLKPGANTIRFVVASSAVELNCRIFLWGCHTKVIISDVDGTITRSDVLGHLLPAVGRDWSQVGVAGLYTQIEKNGYKVLYLTARPIGQASQTRAFLHSVSQGSARLPNGPVLMSPNRLVESFAREVIRRKPHEFKIAALREVRSLFAPAYNPFHAGFGNRDTDVISYRAVGLVPHRIFVVNPRGELVVMKAKYESTASYSSLQDLVESVFPDISGHGEVERVQAITESASYNDWNYWKEALPDINIDDILQVQ